MKKLIGLSFLAITTLFIAYFVSPLFAAIYATGAITIALGMNTAGLALNILTPGDLTWNGKEIMSLQEAILERFFNKPALQQFHTLKTGIKAKQQIAFLGSLGLIGKSRSSCSTTVDTPSITNTEKFWNPCKIGFRVEPCWTDILETFFVWGMNNGIKKEDLTNTDFFAFLKDRFSDAMYEASLRHIWFGDTDAANADDNPACSLPKLTCTFTVSLADLHGDPDHFNPDTGVYSYYRPTTYVNATDFGTSPTPLGSHTIDFSYVDDQATFFYCLITFGCDTLTYEARSIFYIMQKSLLDTIEDTVITSIDDLASGSTTAALLPHCTMDFVDFNFSRCFIELFIPTGNQMSGLFINLKDNGLSRAPFGYVTRTVDIFLDTNSAIPPPLSYTFGSSSPAVLQGKTYSVQIFNSFDELESIRSDDGQNKNIWDIVMPYFRTVMALAIFFVMIEDLLGFRFAHGRHSGGSHEDHSGGADPDRNTLTPEEEARMENPKDYSNWTEHDYRSALSNRLIK